MNALSPELTPELRRLIKICGEEAEIGAILITGSGKAFCAGGNVKGMAKTTDPQLHSDTERIQDLQIKQRALTGALLELDKPTVAALPGPAVGAGLALALACDIRIASKQAFVTTGYAKIALSGDYGITKLLVDTVGAARALELLLLSERIDADRCEKLGVVNRVVDHNQLEEVATNIAEQLANGPAAAIKMIKKNVRDALELNAFECMDREAERMIMASTSADHKEAVAAFIEKRPAIYSHHPV